MKLGGLSLSSPWVLAPLESVSDVGFRRLCWSLGAGLTFTEMIRARGIVRRNKSTLDLIDSFDDDVPTGAQLLVANERELTEALGVLDSLAATTRPQWKNLCAVDLNFGCPSPEVIRVGAGPALLKRAGKLRSIFEVLRRWKATTALPIRAITAKIRLGLNRAEMDQRVFLPIVDLANELLDGLTVHARHAREASADSAHWQALQLVRERATVPIIGNGDALTAGEARRLKSETGCDGVMIARGAIKNPWLFRALVGSGAETPSLEELEQAEKRWLERATSVGSKPKYLEWHREGFRRMRARVAGANDAESLPANANLE